IGPKAVEREWRKSLRGAGVPFEYFIHAVLNTVDPAHNGDVSELEAIFDQIDSSWLIIIDESHELRNRYNTKIINHRLQTIERLAHQRLQAAIVKSGCKVLLLTGTLYSSDLRSVYTHLCLLPDSGTNNVAPVMGVYKD